MDLPTRYQLQRVLESPLAVRLCLCGAFGQRQQETKYQPEANWRVCEVVAGEAVVVKGTLYSVDVVISESSRRGVEDLAELTGYLQPKC